MAAKTVLTIAVGVVAVYSTITGYNGPMDRRWQQGFDALMQRVAPARDRLPVGVTVTYITDLPPSDNTTLIYLIAQYAVAPHLLVPLERGARSEWAVGIFSRRDRAAEAAARAGFSVVEDLGAGILILRRTAK